ncbi:MAG: hypothetical protein IPP61_15480 [Cytophagaceae bacterium]|nr:hypothetical protein [Cytophagaceae bacterium]MBK9932581.1 hypothetical protein [Cytophagaceae bacterium]MBL0303735.1 hypothetical protein [Cytophagaceae bacterium]MBL0326558.1 hypothetical protein [Cytophagaceae bacterium]
MLANRYKVYSYFLIPTGILFLIFYLRGIKPEFLNIPVFAIASTYIENRTFSMVQTNAMDELGFLFLISGILLLVLTQEKNENFLLNELRLKAFFFAFKFTMVLWLICYFLFYGYIIFPISMLSFLFFILVYYVYFRIICR